MTTAGHRELTGDGGEDEFDLISKPDQNRDRNDGNESENQGVLGESLAAFAFLGPAEVSIGFHDLILSFSQKKSAR